jgi:hypothetical protein
MSPSAVPSGRTVCVLALAPVTSVPLIAGPTKVSPVSATMWPRAVGTSDIGVMASFCGDALPGIGRVRDIHHEDGAVGVGVQPAPDDTAPHPTVIGISRSRRQRPPAFWAALGWHARVNLRVRVVSDVLSARQGIAVLVFLDEHRQPTESELLVPCTPDASLPIDVHVGADHPNEQTSGTTFAHLAALAFPSVALLRKGFHSLSPIMVCTLSSISILHCPSLSFDLALRGLHGLGFEALSRSEHELLTHGPTPSGSASADPN